MNATVVAFEAIVFAVPLVVPYDAVETEVPAVISENKVLAVVTSERSPA